MTQEEIVRLDDQISAMRIEEEVLVVGMTATDLSRLLVEHTSPCLRDSEVTVDLSYFSKTTVYVGGEVGRSGAVPCREGVAGEFWEAARLESFIPVRAPG
jgi:hypothetical protein